MMTHRKTLSRKSTGLAAAVLPVLLLCGCTQGELADLVPGTKDQPAGAPVAFNILLQDAPDYGSPEPNSPATRSREPLISEWVRASSFSVTRSAEEDSESWRMAVMELYEDSVPARAQTRTVSPMPAGHYFRVMAFEKTGTGPKDYVFRCAADYTSNGGSAPVLKQGEIILPMGKTYRFAAYSFNNTTGLGALPTAANCKWEDATTAIKIPNLDNDFLTFISGDMKASGSSLNLPVTFTHQLCRLTIKISVTGGDTDTFSNCTGGYVKQGGRSSLWIIGPGDIATSTINTASFNIPDNSQTTFCRLVPNTAASTISVHFGTLTVDGAVVDNVDITSSQSVRLMPGRSYTLTARFQKKPSGPGIVVPPGDIDLGGPGCDGPTKSYLSKLRWGSGNLRQQGDDGSGPNIMAGPTEFGHYYTFMSEYTGTTVSNGKDPCKSLAAATYGTGWRTPSKEEMEALSRCTNRTLTGGGMWFMNSTTGLFLPAAGDRYDNEGSGTTPTHTPGLLGFYWSSGADGSNGGYFLYFNNGGASVSRNVRAYGFPVRCVKGL